MSKRQGSCADFPPEEPHPPALRHLETVQLRKEFEPPPHPGGRLFLALNHNEWSDGRPLEQLPVSEPSGASQRGSCSVMVMICTRGSAPQPAFAGYAADKPVVCAVDYHRVIGLAHPLPPLLGLG